MKTIKEIAESIGVDKQKVYRFIRKNHINESHHEVHHEAHQKRNVMHYDEAAENVIRQHFAATDCITESHHEVHHEAHQTTSLDTVFDTVIATLKSELDAKNKQLEGQQKTISEQQITIRELTAALENTTESLNAAQALHAGTIKTQMPEDEKLTYLIPEESIQPKKRQNLFDRIFGRR